MSNDPLEPIPMASDALSQGTGVLEVDTSSELAAPIIVENTLWSAVNPQAYGGGQPPQITHLRELELEDKGDTGRWRMLDIIPTKADYILDYIRTNSLWPLTSGLACCAIEMMSAATPINDMDRFNMFPFRASPRQADVLIVDGTVTTE